MTPGDRRQPIPDRPGRDAVGSVVKRYRKRDRQHTYGLRIRAYGERHWIALGTEREGWNDVRAADRRDEITALIRRGAWRPPNTFELDPREKNPGFHEFASDWLKRYRRTVDGSTADTAEYMLSHHLLPFLHTYRLDEIDYAVLSAYVADKLERNEEVEAARNAGVTLRNAQGQARRLLSPITINMSLDLAARILKDAVKRGLLSNNSASDRELRLHVTQRKGNFLEADELLALIDAASGIDEPVSNETLARAELTRRMRRDNRTWKQIAAELGVAESTAIWLAGRHRKDGHASPRRAILATLGCAGLRNSEVCELNLGDLDFAHAVIHVRDAKTEAGVRQVNMTPWLHDELLVYRAARADAQLDEPAFPTRTGARRANGQILVMMVMRSAGPTGHRFGSGAIARGRFEEVRLSSTPEPAGSSASPRAQVESERPICASCPRATSEDIGHREAVEASVRQNHGDRSGDHRGAARTGFAAMSDRQTWLEEWCPECRASPGTSSPGAVVLEEPAGFAVVARRARVAGATMPRLQGAAGRSMPHALGARGAQAAYRTAASRPLRADLPRRRVGRARAARRDRGHRAVLRSRRPGRQGRDGRSRSAASTAASLSTWSGGAAAMSSPMRWRRPFGIASASSTGIRGFAAPSPGCSAIAWS